MKYLYLAGIALAVVVLVILGLNKERGTKETHEQEQMPLSVQLSTTTTVSSTTTQIATTTSQKKSMVTIQTTLGSITLELFTEDMPITTTNFIKLAEAGFYDGVKFHRVIDGFMIQGGDPLTKDDTQKARWGTGGPGYAIKDEFSPSRSNVRGTIAMANAGPNTGGSQFFINVADNTFLDGKHPVFGRVTEGMNVVDAIVNTPRDARDVPLTAVVIQKVMVTH